MTSTALALPMTGDANSWNDQERALVVAAGLVRRQGNEEFLADRPTVEAFLAHCRRTGLDPIARQIYAIYRAGKWGIQISIDGARLVAERTGRYEGQTPTQWTADGVTWVDVWLQEGFPRAARVGVYRTGFREPLYAVANWDSYAVMYNGSPSDMWKKFGPLMLGKCAEMLALRKAFPQDLSGLYTTEEMSQAEAKSPAQPRVEEVTATVIASDRDWAKDLADAGDLEAVRDLYREAQRDGLMALDLTDAETGESRTLEAALWARAKEFEMVTVVDVESEPEEPRAWVAEGEALSSAVKVRALYQEALAAGAEKAALEGLEARLAVLEAAERGAEPGGDWASGEEPVGDEWGGQAAVLSDAPESKEKDA